MQQTRHIIIIALEHYMKLIFMSREMYVRSSTDELLSNIWFQYDNDLIIVTYHFTYGAIVNFIVTIANAFAARYLIRYLCILDTRFPAVTSAVFGGNTLDLGVLHYWSPAVTSAVFGATLLTTNL